MRCRGFPYDASEATYIMKNLWGRSSFGRLLFVTTRAVSGHEPLVFFPTTAVMRRLPGRRWAEYRRFIRDGRFANLLMPK